MDDHSSARVGGLSQRSNSKFTKCHYHAPNPEPLALCRHRRRILLAPSPFLGCTVICAKDRCRSMERGANSCALRETPAPSPHY